MFTPCVCRRRTPILSWLIASSAGLLVLSAGEAQAAGCCCGGGLSPVAMMQTQLMQAQLLQAQVAQLQSSQLLQQAALQNAALAPLSTNAAPWRSLKTTGTRKTSRPTPVPEDEPTRLARQLVQGIAAQRGQAREQLKEGKGVAYTQKLAWAISWLDGEEKELARDALSERMARMTADTLRSYLQCTDAESCRAAALACAMKGDKVLVADLIAVLETTPQSPAVPAVRTALKSLTRQDFGPATRAAAADRVRAAAAWKAWWQNEATR